MNDIEVFEHEMECVRRKAKINCTNCGSCDLLMDDKRILTAYENAISAMKLENTCTLHETGYDEAFCSWGKCSKCGADNMMDARYCYWCGAKVVGTV